MILSWLLLLPLIGMLVILAMPKTSASAIRRVAIAVTLLTLLVSLQLLGGFQASSGSIQCEEKLLWIPQLQVFYHLGIDGLSLPMVLLTTLLSFLACLASHSIKERQKEYYVLYLLLELGMLGTFLSLDLFLFYVFWEIVLVPMYFLIGIWGGGRREYSAFKFFVYTLAGSLVMLLGILALYFRAHTFDITTLAQLGHAFDLRFQQWLFLAFFLGFAVKVPVFPFHTWLPDAHVDAPTPISVLLAGVLLKMGGYGFFRISYPLFPEGAKWFAMAMATFAVINIVYGAFVALAQTDLKRLVAYSSVSHMGFVLLGLSSFTPEGMNGAMLQMVSHGLLTGAMFLLVGVLYDRAHTRQLDAFGGLGAKLPVYAFMLTFFSLGSLGLPGLSGFVAEFLSFVGTFGVWRWQTVVSLLGVIGAAAYMLTVLQRVLLGPMNERWKSMPDMTRLELASVVPLIVCVRWIGVQPAVVLRLQETSIQALIQHVSFSAFLSH